MVSKSTQNVINYLNGSGYFKDTLYKDIETVAAWAHNKMQFEGYEEYDRLFRIMVDERIKECLKFFNVLYTKYPSFILEQYEIYSNYPFRLSRDPKADKDIIFKTIGYEHDYKGDHVSEFSTIVTSFIKTAGVEIPDDFDDLLYNTICNYGIGVATVDIETMKYAKFVSRISDTPFPETLDKAKDMFNADNNKENTGFFGEHLAIEHIKKFLEPGDEIHWVSKELGDGFGYDILVHNTITGKVTVFEVKAHNFREEFEKNVLTTTEEACRVNSENKDNNYEFRVLKLYLNRKIGDFEPKNYVAQMDLIFLDSDNVWKRKIIVNNIKTVQQIIEEQNAKKNN